ncbi:NAD-dependent succinate-semialdehyde dehydrogenase [Sutcliffiella horikoshii]|uniref:NAD-dependent succinate-semialdehyde dehydrogenase n=1 Tax=Sutcliffiella horikoshii TaxID=79883 RepID=UPI00203AD4F2|nr:NAD-dependent succinate-semialdehyde dehydrogenase [Sutcliffiella horikoshii]MCM3615950.1 NAD-dependent succinate-semialdehyde dehydrogenase [Sutcliffiella horikoshii]
MYINGEWVTTDEVIEVTNPATGEVIGTVPSISENQLEEVVQYANEAFQTWRNYTAYERADLMDKWFNLLEENKKLIAETLTKEQGKPFREALGEVGYANSFVEWYKEEGKRIYGETIPSSSKDKRVLIQKQPVGVVAAITPWNFPAAMITRKVAPALAAGCTVIVKPAGQTPLTALMLAKYAEEAGIPKGVLQVVTGKSSVIGETLMKHNDVKKLTFTGSTEIGKKLMEQAAQTVKKLSLELGGHAPFIVFEDADLEKAAKGLVQSKFRNAGQTCICANRIYVHESVAEKFTSYFVEEVSKLKVGNGMERGVDLGPLIDEEALDKVKEHLSDAKGKGASVAYGGDVKDGTFMDPTVITGVNDDMQCMKEETFGPLAPITTFKDEEEVIKRANNSPYGLAAYVYTEKMSRIYRVTEGLDYGIIGVNDGGPSVAQAPFGGLKESGIGREGGHHGLEEFLEVKYISIGI